MRAALDEEEMEFTLVDSSLETVISGQQLTLNTTRREVSYDGFQQLGDNILYWKLPSEFLGNKARTINKIFMYTYGFVCPFQLSSYGGYLEFTLRFVPSPGEEEPSDGEALVELSVCSQI